MRNVLRSLVALAATLLVAAACAQSEPGKKVLAWDRPETQTEGKLKVESPAFKEGQPIPEQFSQVGRNASPALTWSGAPKETQAFALIVEDPDAPLPKPFLHWVIYNIPATATALPEAIPQKEKPDKPAGALQGRDGMGRIGYAGPRPPKGDPPRHYHFQLFALDAALDLPPGATLEKLLKAMKGHVIARGQAVGTFQIK